MIIENTDIFVFFPCSEVEQALLSKVAFIVHLTFSFIFFIMIIMSGMQHAL